MVLLIGVSPNSDISSHLDWTFRRSFKVDIILNLLYAYNIITHYLAHNFKNLPLRISNLKNNYEDLFLFFSYVGSIEYCCSERWGE